MSQRVGKREKQEVKDEESIEQHCRYIHARRCSTAKIQGIIMNMHLHAYVNMLAASGNVKLPPRVNTYAASANTFYSWRNVLCM